MAASRAFQGASAPQTATSIECSQISGPTLRCSVRRCRDTETLNTKPQASSAHLVAEGGGNVGVVLPISSTILQHAYRALAFCDGLFVPIASGDLSLSPSFCAKLWPRADRTSGDLAIVWLGRRPVLRTHTSTADA